MLFQTLNDNSQFRILYPEKLAIVKECKRKSWPLSELHRQYLKNTSD